MMNLDNTKQLTLDDTELCPTEDTHILKYVGGKFFVADWIISYLPQHTCYVELFGGAAHVMLKKPPSKVEIYNDLNGELCNLFTVLRAQKDEFVKFFDYVPYSRELRAEWSGEWKKENANNSHFERACRFFYLQNTSFAGNFGSGFGVSKTVNDAHGFRNKVANIERFVARFRNVTIENLDFEKCLNKYDSNDTLFYCDPPYYTKIRYYDDLGWSLDDHKRLAKVLSEVKGKVVLSYYLKPEVAELYNNWFRTTKEVVAHSYGLTRHSKFDCRPSRTEALLMNFRQRDLSTDKKQTKIIEFGGG